MKKTRKDSRKKEKNPRQHRGSHHIFPTSRQWDNIYPNKLWPPESEKHTYWHALFSNMIAEEVIWILRKYMNADGTLKEEFFSTAFTIEDPFKFCDEANIKYRKNKKKIPKRQEAWQIVFGTMNGREAIEWIEREFIRKEWLEASQ